MIPMRRISGLESENIYRWIEQMYCRDAIRKINKTYRLNKDYIHPNRIRIFWRPIWNF
jgi:hypothetical protein